MGLGELSALLQVIVADLVLAADNAVVVAMAAAGLPLAQRKKAIAIGIAAAVILRIVFSVATVQLLKIPGVMVLGGLLLLWVAWKLYVDLKDGSLAVTEEAASAEHAGGEQKSFARATTQIVIADVSMSLDNVLAVAGIAHDYLWVLIVGLALSVVLMAVAATFIAQLLVKHVWIAWIGLVLIVAVAFKMMYIGYPSVLAWLGT